MQSPDLLYLSADFLFSSLELKLTQVISVTTRTTFFSSLLSFFHRLATVTSICRSLSEISVNISVNGWQYGDGFHHLRDHRSINHAGYDQPGAPPRQSRYYRAHQNAQLDDACRSDAQFHCQRVCLPPRLHCRASYEEIIQSL